MCKLDILFIYYSLKRNLHLNYLIPAVVLLLSISCVHSSGPEEETPGNDKPDIIVKRRDDGTISSVNQVINGKIVHGVRATYYRDGKTLYSKQTYNYGVKHGPATWYYRSGSVFKLTHFEDGKRQGLTRIYYKNGDLLAEFESEKGNVKPGLKEYEPDGTLITSYPEIAFREIDHLSSGNRVDLEVFCKKRKSGVKFYVLKEEEEKTSRIYLITENDRALLQYYVKPGASLQKQVDILAEIPTELGNLLVKKYSYQLNITH